MATSHLSNLERVDQLQEQIHDAKDRLLGTLETLPADHPVSLAANDLLARQNELRDLLSTAYKNDATQRSEFSGPHEEAAAIEIERDAHTLKADFKDVLKALFLWRDDPAKRVRDKGEFRSDFKNAPL